MSFGVMAHLFIWLSFENVYSAKIFTPVHFTKQFHSGIYQYRILSTYWVEVLYPLLKEHHLAIPQISSLHDKTYDPYLFTSITLVNLVFLIGICHLIYVLTKEDYFPSNTKYRTLIALLLLSVCALSQFVILPYDYSAWFFLLLSLALIYAIDKRFTSWKAWVLSIVFILGCFNRETAALSLALFTSLFLWKSGINKLLVYGTLIGFFLFSGIYMGLRYYFGSMQATDGSLLVENFSKPQNLFGGVFMLILFGLSLFLSLRTNRSLVLLFHLFSLPYLGICIYSGILYEIRLYVPMFLVSVIIGNYKNTPSYS